MDIDQEGHSVGGVVREDSAADGVEAAASMPTMPDLQSMSAAATYPSPSPSHPNGPPSSQQDGLLQLLGERGDPTRTTLYHPAYPGVQFSVRSVDGAEGVCGVVAGPFHDSQEELFAADRGVTRDPNKGWKLGDVTQLLKRVRKGGPIAADEPFEARTSHQGARRYLVTASLPAFPAVEMSPITAQKAESATHSKMEDLDAFIERCNSEGCGDLMVVRSTMFDALEVENLVQSTLASSMATHFKTSSKPTPTHPSVLRLSPSNGGSGVYDAVAVLRAISMAMWPRPKGGKMAILREVDDMLDKSRDPPAGGPVDAHLLVERMLDKLKWKRNIWFFVIPHMDTLPLSVLADLTTDRRSKVAIIGLQTVSGSCEESMMLESTHSDGLPKYEVLRLNSARVLVNAALGPPPRKETTTSPTAGKGTSSSLAGKMISALQDRFAGDIEDDDNGLCEPRAPTRVRNKPKKQKRRVRREGLGDSGEGEYRYYDMGHLVEGGQPVDTVARAPSMAPLKWRQGHLPMPIMSVNDQSKKENPAGTSTKARLVDQLRSSRVKPPPPLLPLNISRLGTLSSNGALATTPSPLLPPLRTPSLPGDDCSGGDGTPPSDDRTHHDITQGLVEGSLAAELRRSRKVLSTHPFPAAVATASPAAKINVEEVLCAFTLPCNRAPDPSPPPTEPTIEAPKDSAAGPTPPASQSPPPPPTASCQEKSSPANNTELQDATGRSACDRAPSPSAKEKAVDKPSPSPQPAAGGSNRPSPAAAVGGPGDERNTVGQLLRTIRHKQDPGHSAYSAAYEGMQFSAEKMADGRHFLVTGWPSASVAAQYLCVRATVHRDSHGTATGWQMWRLTDLLGAVRAGSAGTDDRFEIVTDVADGQERQVAQWRPPQRDEKAEASRPRKHQDTPSPCDDTGLGDRRKRRLSHDPLPLPSLDGDGDGRDGSLNHCRPSKRQRSSQSQHVSHRELASLDGLCGDKLACALMRRMREKEPGDFHEPDRGGIGISWRTNYSYEAYFWDNDASTTVDLRQFPVGHGASPEAIFTAFREAVEYRNALHRSRVGDRAMAIDLSWLQRAQRGKGQTDGGMREGQFGWSPPPQRRKRTKGPGDDPPLDSSPPSRPPRSIFPRLPGRPPGRREGDATEGRGGRQKKERGSGGASWAADTDKNTSTKATVITKSQHQSDVTGVAWVEGHQAWMATWYEKGDPKMKQNCFYVRNHGFDRAKALAENCRLEIERTGRAVVKKRSEHQSGVKGFYLNKGAWVAQWQVGGERNLKPFSVRELGYEGAKQAAIAHRRAMEERHYTFKDRGAKHC
ncbi:unnamed protein product [Vitrella brassicaformis CCMP3155]|uniref:AP2/ERF domain-containing protein n=1 Tax=Vitrella brassicaformis (strain CCMP3155) TaxID=1169540 RepID=A0A0G4FR58_VITBC|nr:unnamed protein product [Vitrella brassicaformis CCMP3155]|eukprot:CEM16954.1 unnamed protein product [Vitrella brassicaformis CCMP3155]